MTDFTSIVTKMWNQEAAEESSGAQLLAESKAEIAATQREQKRVAAESAWNALSAQNVSPGYNYTDAYAGGATFKPIWNCLKSTLFQSTPRAEATRLASGVVNSVLTAAISASISATAVVEISQATIRWTKYRSSVREVEIRGPDDRKRAGQASA